MSLLPFVAVFVLVGVVLAWVNGSVARVLQPDVVTLLNAAVLAALVLWTLSVLGALDALRAVRVGP